MKKSNNIIIIGCSIPSLYAAIKYLDYGYKVQIIEKKNSVIPIYDSIYHNFTIYNDNHKSYINLLKRFDIKSEKLSNIKINNHLMNIINILIQKSKLIPHHILITYTFRSLYENLLSDDKVNILNYYDNCFGGIFETYNALDCINMFTNDIICCNDNASYYRVSLQSINELLSKMISYVYSKNGRIIYNQQIKTIKYVKRKFIMSTNNHIIYNSDIILTTMSKHNLFTFNFWNNEQYSLLNTVNMINSTHIKNMIDTIVSFNDNNGSINEINGIRNILLDDLHIVYPQYTAKDSYVYLWNYGLNNIIIRERIKSMYNNHFVICSESFSKNNMFINYSLELIDNIIYI